MGTKIPARGGDEEDAFSRYARRVTRWKRGELKSIKRRYNKRFRRIAPNKED